MEKIALVLGYLTMVMGGVALLVGCAWLTIEFACRRYVDAKRLREFINWKRNRIGAG